MYIEDAFFARVSKFTIDFCIFCVIIVFARADVMELADVTDSKSVALTGMRVRPPPSAPEKARTACFFVVSGIAQRKNPARMHGIFGGSGWIRTTEVTDNRFTVCPLWPLGNAPNYKAPHIKCTRLLWSW